MSGEGKEHLISPSGDPLKVSAGILTLSNLPSNIPIINTKVNNIDFPLLTDSGANINLIYFDGISSLNKNLIKIIPCNVELKGFSNDSIRVCEKTILPIQISGKIFETEFYISRSLPQPLSYCGILGNKFLSDNLFSLDFKNRVLKNSSVSIPFLHSDHSNSSYIFSHSLNNDSDTSQNCYTSGIYTFEPHSERIVKIHANNNYFNRLSDTVLLEPVQLSNSLLVARSVSKFSNSNTYFVKIANFTSKSLTLQKNCKIATISPIQPVSEFSINIVNANTEFDENPFEVWGGKFNLDHLAGQEKEKLQNLLETYKHIFANSVKELEGCDTILHDIKLKDTTPVRQRPYRVPYHLRDELDKQINELLESDIIQESDSPYAAPVLFVKKSDGTFRLVCDFRKLNDKTIEDSFPIPNINDMINDLSGAKYFSTLDLTSGFYQMKLHPDDTFKTGFSTSKNHYEWKRVPFGLKNAPSSFQRLMSIILADLSPLQIGIYIDDIIIASKSFDEHLNKLKIVFDRLNKHKLKLKPSKCKFLLKSVTYLGYHVSNGIVQPDPSNLNVVKNFAIPSTKKNVRQFLGLTGFYRRFIQNYAEKSLPLTNLLKNESKFVWSAEAQSAFDTLKSELLKEPILILPDFNKSFSLCTDASNHSLGAILCHEDENKFLHPVAYASRKLKGAEMNYSTVEREALGVVWAISYFKHYLLGKHFVVYCDQASLSNVLKLKDPTSRIARWIMTLSQYDYEIKHKPGKLNLTADYLSRNVNIIDTSSKSQDFHIDSSLYNRIITSQLSDPKCTKIKNCLDAKKTPFPQSILFYVKDNVLYCTHKKPKNRFQKKEKIFVPLALVPDILKLCHDSSTAAHGGFKRTLFKIRQNFYWPLMYSHIYNYVKSCPNCVVRRGYHANQKAPIQRVPVTSFPFEKIALDIVGPFPLTKFGNRFLLVITDYFTRWPEAYPIENTKSETILRCLENFISTHGVCKHIVTDKGSNFISEVISKFYKKFNIVKHTTTSYHPQSDGVVERLNSTLINSLSHLVSDTQEDWDRHINFALFAHRTAKHAATGETPAYLLYGRDLVLPETLISNSNIPSYQSVNDYTDDLISRLSNTYVKVKSNLTKAAVNQESLQHKKSVDKKIKVGDTVYLYTPVVRRGQVKKLTKLNRGPFKVVSQTTPVNFVISDLKDSSATQTVHVDRLTLLPDRQINLKFSDKSNTSTCSHDESNIKPVQDFKRSNKLSKPHMKNSKYNLRKRKFVKYT